jgi:hypothetical protein
LIATVDSSLMVVVPELGVPLWVVRCQLAVVHVLERSRKARKLQLGTGGITYGRSFGVAASSGRGGGRLMIIEGVLAAIVTVFAFESMCCT